MFDFIKVVKAIFTSAILPSRKRRAEPDDNERTIAVKKARRMSNSQLSCNEDDWISSSSSGSIRRQHVSCTNGNKYIENSKLNDQKSKLNWSKSHPVIMIDDDDDDAKRRSMLRSKRMPLYPTGRDLMRNCNSLEKRTDIKKRPVLRNSFPSNGSNNLTKIMSNGNSNIDLTHAYNLFKDDKSCRPTIRRSCSTALDQSIRLDEKKKYQEMLNKSLLNPFDSFNDYSTPIGKVLPSSCMSRGRKCVELATATGTKPKTIAFVDLTKPRLSARDRIAKVLDNFENDVVEVKDNDSDIEILPSPPTPEPDIKIERVNSLKTYVDLSETTKDDWITNLMKTHRESISKQRQKIKEQEKIKKKLCDINTEIRIKKLEDDVEKVLKIKDYLLPIEKQTEKLPQLTPEQERKVNICFDRRASENEVLISKFNLNITRRDLMTLNGLNWLNDEVINFYMNLIIERAKNSKWPKAHAMNTFFYHKISKDGYTSVRRWTKKVDIFSFDLLVVPIHLSMHWCMAIVDFRSKTINYYDSMGSNNDKCLKILYNYLQQEHLDKKRTEYIMGGWDTNNVKKIPQQMNGSDCGMFACTFAEFLTRDAKITFTQEDMPYLRRKMAVEILEGRLLMS